MIKAEIYQDKAILLDTRGRLWVIEIGWDMQPTIRMIKELKGQMIDYMLEPKLVSCALVNGL